MPPTALQTYFNHDPYQELPLEVLTATLAECQTWQDDYGRVPLVSASAAQEVALHSQADRATRQEYANKNVQVLKDSTTPDTALQSAYTALYFPNNLSSAATHLPMQLFKGFITTLKELKSRPNPHVAGAVSELALGLVMTGLHQDGIITRPSYFRQNDNMMHIPYPEGRKLWDFTVESSGQTIEPGRYLVQAKTQKHGGESYFPPIAKIHLGSLLSLPRGGNTAERINGLVRVLRPIVYRIPDTNTLKVELTDSMKSYIFERLTEHGALDDSRALVS